MTLYGSWSSNAGSVGRCTMVNVHHAAPAGAVPTVVEAAAVPDASAADGGARSHSAAALQAQLAAPAGVPEARRCRGSERESAWRSSRCGPRVVHRRSSTAPVGSGVRARHQAPARQSAT